MNHWILLLLILSFPNTLETLVAKYRLGNMKVIENRLNRLKAMFHAFNQDEHWNTIDTITDQILSSSAETTRLAEYSTHNPNGIGYWVDVYLGTHQKVSNQYPLRIICIYMAIYLYLYLYCRISGLIVPIIVIYLIARSSVFWDQT